MLSPQEFIHSWKADDLISYDEAIVQTLAIPQASKLFLIEAGLPQQYFKVHAYYQAFPHLPAIGDTFSGDFSFSMEHAHYRVLSVVRSTLSIEYDEILAFFCLDEHSDGQIIEMFSTGTGLMNAGFRNSSISQFAECLLLFNEYNRWVNDQQWAREREGRPFTYDQWEVKSQEVHLKLHQVDPAAFDASNIPDGMRNTVWNGHLNGFDQHVDWSP